MVLNVTDPVFQGLIQQIEYWPPDKVPLLNIFLSCIECFENM